MTGQSDTYERIIRNLQLAIAAAIVAASLNLIALTINVEIATR
jgi:hypothetical protein